ncbi:hypothetical protein L6452_26519 [Arctium lappa]|uniref:Uncharacterized protein n=1 Tax=Arctium lappa TaxID=4217 RepID=A0ACB8ZZ68_ARCLA|nr:hypothetical protein L6452_26519 [Arctium lappa]
MNAFFVLNEGIKAGIVELVDSKMGDKQLNWGKIGEKLRPRDILVVVISIPILDEKMMNYQSTPRSNRPRGFVVRNVLQFALFVAFSLWLLYQIRQPNSDGGSPGIQLSTDGIPNLLGRKGSAGLSKSTPDDHSGLTLEDVTNPGEDGEIPRYSKQIPEVEFRLKTGSEGNDRNTLLHGQDGHTKSNKDGSLTMAKSNITFPDENGIPQHVRDKFVGMETSESGNGTRVKIQSVIATRAGIRGHGTLEES